MKKSAAFFTVVLLALALLSFTVFATPSKTYRGKEDVPTLCTNDRWKWNIIAPIVMTGSVNGEITLNIDAWGNYSGIIDYYSENILQKCYFIKIEGYGLGEGYADTDYGQAKLRVNGDPRQGSSGYNSQIPFRVLGYRIVRVTDFADVEIRLVIPSAWMHGKITYIFTIYDEMEIKLNTTLAFWNKSHPFVPDNIDFPLSVGERWWFNSVVHVYGYMWNSRDSQGWINERNSTFDENETWNYTMSCNEIHDVSTPAGTFPSYSVIGVTPANEENLHYEYSNVTKMYVKETYKNIRFGGGYLSLYWTLTEFSVTYTNNKLTINPSTVFHGQEIEINGEMPLAQNEEIIVCIPEWSIYYNVHSTASGVFSLRIRIPLLYDVTKTSIDHGSLGILAFPLSNPQNLVISTLTILVAPPYIIHGYVKFYGNITPNYTGMSVYITNNMTGETVIVPVNESTGYYSCDLSILFYGYSNGDKIYGYVLYNNRTYWNETFVDTSVSSKHMDIIISEGVLAEFSYILIFATIALLPIFRKLELDE